MNFIEIDNDRVMKQEDVCSPLNMSPAGSVISIDENLTDCSGDCKEQSAGGEYTGCFEGPEKTLEVCFRPDMGPEAGLRVMTRDQIDFLCFKAKCTVLHSISNAYMDAYVLSESSLFVYKHKYIMKTCGTTTLLRCLGFLLEFADALGMELSWVGYSRKNLLYPTAQLFPHSNFGEEIRYISTHEKLQNRLEGNGHILGPITGDHWFVYVADHSNTSPLAYKTLPYIPATPSTERTLNMMMFDMDPEVAKIFYMENSASGKEMTKKAGINALCPGAQIDEAAFTPCGYSMNAILYDAYFTIHITPEPACSYVSFETNALIDNYCPLVRNVLNAFKPKRFVLTMFGDQGAIDSMKSLPTDSRKILVPSVGSYNRTSLSSTKVDMELCCMMACFGKESAPMSRSASQVALADLHL